jgi:hypothetical protein
VACAEFGSYAFVHPVIRRLPSTAHLQVEQGLLRTFGRVMPVGMTLCVVLAIPSASSGDGGSRLWRWLAVAAVPLSRLNTANAPNQRAEAGRTVLKRCSVVGGRR